MKEVASLYLNFAIHTYVFCFALVYFFIVFVVFRKTGIVYFTVILEYIDQILPGKKEIEQKFLVWLAQFILSR